MAPEQVFLQVVEAGSLKAAAELLGVEPSSVTRKMASLEKRLGVKLLRRSTRRSAPTELGLKYYERLRGIVDEQTALEEEIRGGVAQLRGKMRIAAPSGFGVRFVLPVVQNMQKQADDLAVDLLLGSYPENLTEQNIDVAVRVGDLPNSNLYARKLGENPRVLVASTDYLASHGTPATPADLVAHQFILYTPHQHSMTLRFANGQLHTINHLKSQIAVNSIEAVRTLALDGAGIHLGPLWLFQQDIERGELVQLLPNYPLQSFPVNAVYTSRQYLPFKVKEFIRLMKKQLIALPNIVEGA